MAKRTWLPVLAVLASLVTASAVRADIPVGLEEPDEDAAKETALAWLTAAKAGDAKALTELALLDFGGGEFTYTQVTMPADAKLRKRCFKVTTVKNDKALKKALPCLLTPDLKAALASVIVDGAGFAASYDDIRLASPGLTKAKRALKKLDDAHVYWTFVGMVDGVAHSFTLAIAVEFASGSPQVGAVVHDFEK